MRLLPVVLREEAIADLYEIYDYIRDVSGSPDIAIGFVRRIRLRCEKIGQAPLGGISRPDLGSDTRLVPFEKSAVIAYRVRDEAIEILNIFYGGRDYEALLK